MVARVLANGYGKAFLAGVIVSGGLVMGLVVYIHEGDVKRLDNLERGQENLEHNIGVMLVEQAKTATKIDALVEWTRERIALIERKLP